MNLKITVSILVVAFVISLTTLGFTLFSNKSLTIKFKSQEDQITMLKTDNITLENKTTQLQNQMAQLQSGSLLNTALTVAKLIKDNDMVGLSTHVHPTKGLRFSPWPYILTSNPLFTQLQVSTLSSNPDSYVWGPSSGPDIIGTYGSYYSRYVYDHDFLNPHIIGNNTIVGDTISTNNMAQFFPNSSFVQFYFNRFNPMYEGMDWSSLYLIFTKESNVWYLIGIAHDQWSP